MRCSTVLTVLLIMLLAAAPAMSWRVFPLVSYSSSSGVLLGGVVSHNMVPPFRPLGLSCMAYGYTGGSLWAGPEVFFPAGSALGHVQLVYRIDRKTSFYGWGNGGDDDEKASCAREMQRLNGEFHLAPAGGFIVSLGGEIRHSTVYDRESSGLWQTSPTDGFGSLWSAGPFARITWPFPAPVSGYSMARLEHQFGSGFSYSSVETDAALFLPLSSSTVSGLHLSLDRHFDATSTPFAYLPTLGGSEGLRGYGDRRFGGPWTALANLELRQRVFTLELDEENSMGFGLVLFADAGQVADDLADMTWNRFHLDAGIGARLEMPGGGTLRADFAFSPEGLGIQMALGELF